MILFVHLFIRNVIQKVTIMTLNIIFSVLQILMKMMPYLGPFQLHLLELDHDVNSLGLMFCLGPIRVSSYVGHLPTKF